MANLQQWCGVKASFLRWEGFVSLFDAQVQHVDFYNRYAYVCVFSDPTTSRLSFSRGEPIFSSLAYNVQRRSKKTSKFEITGPDSWNLIGPTINHEERKVLSPEMVGKENENGRSLFPLRFLQSASLITYACSCPLFESQWIVNFIFWQYFAVCKWTKRQNCLWRKRKNSYSEFRECCTRFGLKIGGTIWGREGNNSVATDRSRSWQLKNFE